MQPTDNSEVLKQIHEIGELLRLAQTPEGVAVRQAMLSDGGATLRELRGLIQELMDAKGEPDAIER